MDILISVCKLCVVVIPTVECNFLSSSSSFFFFFFFSLDLSSAATVCLLTAVFIGRALCVGGWGWGSVC